jgi:hypothetical protein
MTTAERIEHEIGPNGRITIRVADGDVTIRGADDGVARVGDLEGNLSTMSVERSAEGLTVSSPEAFGLGIVIGRRSHYRLVAQVPRGARAVIQTTSGDIVAEGLTGEQAYRTVSGAMDLTNLGGAVSVETTSGDVGLRGVDRVALTGRSVSGDVRATAACFAQLRFQTTSGDLRLGGAFADDREHSVESVSGDVRIDLEGDLVVEATTVSGRLRSSLPHESLGRPGRRTVTLGRGGGHLAFRSISGDLEVTRGPVDFPAERPAPAPRAAIAPPAASGETADERRLAILRQLELGEIDVAEATRRLASVGGD